jgi:hypothetical protein
MAEKVNTTEEATERMVKFSICSECNGWVRAGDWNLMDLKAKNEFSREAVAYNLSVKHLPLSEFRKFEKCACA